MISSNTRMALDYVTKGALVVFMSFYLLGCSNMAPTGGASWGGRTEYGKASFYAMKHQARRTASGERFNHAVKTAAHRTLPFGSRVRVTNLRTGNSVIVRINDRGPFVRGRVIDLSQSAFKSIASLKAGIISVKLEVVD